MPFYDGKIAKFAELAFAFRENIPNVGRIYVQFCAELSPPPPKVGSSGRFMEALRNFQSCVMYTWLHHILCRVYVLSTLWTSRAVLRA